MLEGIADQGYLQKTLFALAVILFGMAFAKVVSEITKRWNKHVQLLSMEICAIDFVMSEESPQFIEELYIWYHAQPIRE